MKAEKAQEWIEAHCTEPETEIDETARDTRAFIAGWDAAIAKVKEVILFERGEYKNSADEMDRCGYTTMGTNELRCVLTCENIFDQIEKLN